MYTFCAATHVHNSILWADTATEGPEIAIHYGGLDVEYSDVEGGQAALEVVDDRPATVGWTPGNINLDPLFLDDDGSCFWLTSTDSPAIDAGCNELIQWNFVGPAGDLDLTGNERRIDAARVDSGCVMDPAEAMVDMGAYEYNSSFDDCDSDGTPDHCEILVAHAATNCGASVISDCDLNGVPDNCDILNGADDCDTDGCPDRCELGAVDIALVATMPTGSLPSSSSCGDTLWRTQNNYLEFTFACDITAPTSDDLEISEMQSSGGHGTDLASSFTYTVAEDNVTLQIRETGDVLAHQKWYAIRNTGDWADVAEFTRQYFMLTGDGNKDCLVQFADLAFINSVIVDLDPDEDDRHEINGDRLVQFADLAAANAYIGSGGVPKPSGHSGH